MQCYFSFLFPFIFSSLTVKQLGMVNRPLDCNKRLFWRIPSGCSETYC